MAACLWLRLIQESAYKTPVVFTTLNADHAVLDLVDDDAASFEPRANVEQLRAFKACGGRDRAVGETSIITGSFKTPLYPSQAAFLLGMCFRKVSGQDIEGSEVPWPTTEPAGQFASVAADMGYRDDDGNVRSARLLGGKVGRARLSAARGTRDGLWMLEGDMTFSSVDTAGTVPALADYPATAEAPYYFGSTSGGLSVNSVGITDYDSIAIEGAYEMSARFAEGPTVRRIRHNSSDFTIEIAKYLKFTPDWRALQTSRATFPVTLALNYPGGAGQQQITLDFGDNCRVDDEGWSKSYPLAGDKMETLKVVSQYDRDDDQFMTVAIGTQA